MPGHGRKVLRGTAASVSKQNFGKTVHVKDVSIDSHVGHFLPRLKPSLDMRIDIRRKSAGARRAGKSAAEMPVSK